MRYSILGLAILAGLAGCESKPVCLPMDSVQPPQTLIEHYNENAAAMPRLWAYARLEMTLREKPADLGTTLGSSSSLATPNARVLLTKTPADPYGPQDFLLLVKEAGAEVARMGVSRADKAFYCWYAMGDHRDCVYGELTNSPNAGNMTVDPTQLAGLLGVCPLANPATALAKGNLVIQRISCDPCAYILTIIDRNPRTGLPEAKREMYFDRSAVERDGKLIPNPARPFKIRYFDSLGRCVLTAELADYRPVTLEDVDEEPAIEPVVPTWIRLQWHRTGSELKLRLSGMTTADKVSPEAYRFWDRLPPGLKGAARNVRQR